MSTPPPTLEDLRDSRGPAWLWDVVRARLVWANAAAIQAFDASSVFDLIDRPFASDEPAIKLMAELQKALTRGSDAPATLEFPALGPDRAFACRCSLHALADGRDGILAIAAAPPSILAEAGLFEDLPVATFALRQDGSLCFANELARATFDSKAITQFSALLNTPATASDLLNRLGQTKLVSAIATYHSPYGEREARFTLRRPLQGGNVFALVVMEDITERRQLERSLAAAPATPASLAPAEQLAFENLGRTLSEAARTAAPKAETPVQQAPKAQQPAASAAPAPLAPAMKPALPPAVPKALSDAFERNPGALAIIQDEKPAYANARLAHLLGHDTQAALMADDNFWKTLLAAPHHVHRLGLPQADGTLVEMRVLRQTVPWQNGKASQYMLEPMAAQPPLPPSPPQVTPAPPPEAKSITEAAAPSPVVEAVPAPSHSAALPQKPEASEEELRSILDISSDGIVSLDAKGHILNFSAGAEAIFGLRNAEVLNKPFTTLFNPESATILKEYLAGLEGKGLASVFNDGREVTGIVKQGGSVPLFLNIGRVQAKHSAATYCVVLRDITAWKRTEKELREAKDAAEEASRHKSEFLARVSHELRTPLNAILGFSEIMRMGQYGEVRNEKYRGYLNDIHASGSHLLAMINDLLDLSKIESGSMELNFTSVSLSECFDHAAKMLQEQATRARVLMRKAFPDNLPRIVADQKTMRQVLANLLSNAIKYTDPGGQVIVSASVSPQGALTLRLKDTGIGMNAQELQQALMPFMRVDVPGRERQGTGLGLPLTKALVEANRAQFAISSEPGQGTLVEVTFPTTRVLAE